MMLRDLPRDASFWRFLLSIDQDLAETARKKACPCGGRLHCAKYPRKPRGSEELPEQYGHRLSFCCDREGCRKRVTPPSVRFLGRKVYLGAVVVLVAAMRQGPSPRRVAELSRLFGADRRTIARWQVFRFSVVGSLLSAPPPRGQLKAAIRSLAEKTWTHPVRCALSVKNQRLGDVLESLQRTGRIHRTCGGWQRLD